MANTYYQQLQRLHRARQVLKIRRFVFRILVGASVLCVLVVSVLLLEFIFRFEKPVRMIFAVILSIGGTAFLVWSFFLPIISLFHSELPPDDWLAEKIGETFPSIRDRLIDALQVVRDHELHQDGTSNSLAESALKDIDQQTRSLDYRTAFYYPLLFPVLRNLIILLMTGLLLTLFFSKSMTGALYRICRPLRTFEKSIPFQWIIYPGNIQLIQGDSLRIVVDISGEVPDNIDLVTWEADHQPRQIRLKKPFQYRIHSVQRSFDYRIRSGEFESSEFHVNVRERPVVRRLQVQLFSPAYTGIPAQSLESNIGDIHALKGTRAELKITSSHPLKKASLMFENQPLQSMTIFQSVNAGHAISVFKPDHYWIAITDTQGLDNANPIHYAIQVRTDLIPVVRITAPAKDVDLDEQMRLPLSLEAEDDFGLTRVRLAHWICREGSSQSLSLDTVYSPVNFDFPNTRRLLLNYEWDLDPLGLLPRDRVVYFFEVWDNDQISGPKRGRSDTYTARFPSIQEIFKDVTRMQNDQIESLESIADEGQFLDEKLQELSEDIKANREIPWEEKREIKEAVERQSQIEQQVNALENEVNKMIEKLENNDLVSMETLEKYQELQNLFQEIATPELQEAMKQLQESLEKIDQATLRQATENMEINQEMLLKSLERTISLLKKIQMEQKVDEMIRRVEKMSDQQRAVNESLTQDGPSDSLADQESEMQKDAESFEKAMQNLSEAMLEIPNMPSDEMKVLMDSLNRQPLSRQMEEMSKQISEQQTESAHHQGQQISRNLSSISQALHQVKQSMQSQQNKRELQALQHTAFQTLQLSQSQENLMQQMRQGGVSSSESIRRQGAMMQGAKQISDSLYQLSTQMIMMSPQVGRSIGRARARMQQAAEAMQQSNGGVSRHQAQAMGALNETAALLQDMLGDIQAGGMGGMGMDQFIMQIGSMSEQQMALNRKLSDMLGRGELSLQQQAAMSRLAAEQRAIQKHMEQLMRDYGERSDIAGRLGNLIEAMEEVIHELKNNQASQKTIERQEQILSRMLEAQHSVHERDVSRKRRAKSGSDIIRQSPGPLQLDRSEIRDQLMREILRLNEAGYTRDYQELIRQYFEALVRLLEEEGRE
ncbi:hypothetical protein JW835_10075 [bacterium]|nr:hypothetical protein [bacterium]